MKKIPRLLVRLRSWWYWNVKHRVPPRAFHCEGNPWYDVRWHYEHMALDYDGGDDDFNVRMFIRAYEESSILTKWQLGGCPTMVEYNRLLSDHRKWRETVSRLVSGPSVRLINMDGIGDPQTYVLMLMNEACERGYYTRPLADDPSIRIM